jgi:hypothetical protein
MLRDFAFVAAAGRLPRSGPVLCMQCASPMVADRVSRALYCTAHGALMARVVDHPMWGGEVVQVLYQSHAYHGRYVVRFSSGKHRTVWFDDLRLLAMRQRDPGGQVANR